MLDSIVADLYFIPDVRVVTRRSCRSELTPVYGSIKRFIVSLWNAVSRKIRVHKESRAKAVLVTVSQNTV